MSLEEKYSFHYCVHKALLLYSVCVPFDVIESNDINIAYSALNGAYLLCTPSSILNKIALSSFKMKIIEKILMILKLLSLCQKLKANEVASYIY